MDVIKRDGRKEPFDAKKILNAVRKAYKASKLTMSPEVETALKTLFTVGDTIDIEEIQDKVEEVLNEMSEYRYESGQEELFLQLKEAAAEYDFTKCEDVIIKWEAIYE